MNEVMELFRQFPHAIGAGLLTAVVCSLLGVYVILKRMVFIGITLAETATCGVALAFVLSWPPVAGAMLLTLGAVGLLAYPLETARLPRDAAMGVVFLLAAAGSILLVSHSGFGMMEVKALLYGDLILADAADFHVLLGVLTPILLFFLLFRRPLLNTFLDREAMLVLGGHPGWWEALYFLALGLAVSAASKIAGPLLVFAYLLLPAATALSLSKQFTFVLLLTAATALLATLLGIGISFHFDLPTNQTICVTAAGLLLLALAGRAAARTVCSA